MFVRATLVLITLAACISKPPAPQIARTGTTVNASLDATWSAAVDAFSEQNIAIKTMDRASGFIAAEPMSVSDRAADESLYDCGRSYVGIRHPATGAVYNLRVLGEGSTSTVRATVRWVSVRLETTSKRHVSHDCSSTGRWETDAEANIKQRAEAKRP